jgi:circadian clock protein KaiC
MGTRRSKRVMAEAPTLPKAPTGIKGLDELTGGGLPRGRPTLVCGAAGCGKTMLAAEFVLCGALHFDEPGVFMMFEENAQELTQNMRSLGFDLDKLQRQKMLVLDHVHIERSEIEETGDYDLEGLFIRLDHAITSIGAKRVVLDTLEALFSGLPNHAVLRAELRRLFRWLKDRGMTAVITCERGDKTLSRYGLEEYVADCVILLDHRIVEQVSTRRLRVIKYRGSSHGTNEYPFLIGAHGISVLPITSVRLEHKAPGDRVSTGVAGLDDMLGGQGVYRGSSVLVSGSSGTGKSSVAASFADAACARGEVALLFAYEESSEQLLRNMRSIGIDLARWVRAGLLHVHASRPTVFGLEQHLVMIYDLVTELRPSVVVVDPFSNLSIERHDSALQATLLKLIDFLKQHGSTAMFTCLTRDSTMPLAETQLGVSSLIDTWLLLANQAHNSERTRTMEVLKSRGMAHSNQMREFVLGKRGIQLIDVYRFDDRVLTGTARTLQQAREQPSAEEKGHARSARGAAPKPGAVARRRQAKAAT